MRSDVKTIQEVKVMLDNMVSRRAIEPTELTDVLASERIPHQFFCPITQDVMNDPVKTVDGMTYDRPAIERWLFHRSTAPLTGLPLSSKTLTPNSQLREQIELFAKSHEYLLRPIG